MTDQTDGYASRHNQECLSNFGTHTYDDRCSRCKAIKKVVYLRRKNVKNGCPQEEAVAATMVATQIIERYKLTRGEIADRQYDIPMLVKRADIQRNTTANKRKMSAMHHRRTDESLLDDD